MYSSWVWLAQRITRRLWFRASLISLLAIAAALIGFLIGPYIPADVSAKVGAESVDRILGIISTSMLAVTTFSLSTMVAAYSAATGTASPRATQLLIEDTTTQNLLATFVGSFLYSLVSIIIISTDLYGPHERLVLFVVTLLVLILIVVTLLRWIDYLLRLGRVGETANQVEIAATRAMRQRAERPSLGGASFSGEIDDTPANARTITAGTTGYVQHIDMSALSSVAEEANGRVYLLASPGSFVDPGQPVVRLTGKKQDDEEDEIRGAFSVARDRSFEQDPEYGLAVLSEIASRALSPAINDPGTAIDIIGRAVRTFLVWSEQTEEEEPRFPKVSAPRVRAANLFDSFFTPVARDGAGIVEVQVRLQEAFVALARSGNDGFREEAERHAKMALGRAEKGLAFKPDLDRVKKAAGALR